MAILDQTVYNQYIAEGIRNATGNIGDIGVLSGGSMPFYVREAIVELIAATLADIPEDTPSKIPNELYDKIANLMLPFMPSTNKSALVAVLRSNSVFGQIKSGTPNVRNIIDSKLNTFISQYERQQLELEGGLEAVLGSFGISGSLSQIVESVTQSTIVTIRTALEKLLTPFEISKVSVEVVATFLKGSGVLNIFSDLPKSFATVLTSPSIASIVTNVASPTGSLDLDDLSDNQRSDFAGGYVKSASGSDVPLSEFSTLMSQTRGTVAGTVIGSGDQVPAPNPYVIDTDTIDPNGIFISSVEELESEMSGITRDISEVIVHWSETFTNSNLSGAQLTELTGAGDATYHIIIKRDGSLERGLPLNTVGTHCDTLNHNEYSIGICFVGGLNVATGASNLYEVASSRSITRSQYNTFYQIMRVFFNQYPGGQALGHQDIDPDQEDPGFDVRSYVYNNFNKQSLYTDSFTEAALSPQQILEKLEESGEGSPSVLEKDPDVMEKKF